MGVSLGDVVRAVQGGTGRYSDRFHPGRCGAGCIGFAYVVYIHV
jgi:hypothetical protein